MEKHLRTSLVVLWLHFCWVSGKNQVEQHPPSQIIQEGENCTFQCNYTVSPFSHLKWYKQGTGRSPAFLIIMTDDDSKNPSGRYTVTLDATSKHSSLHITAAQLSDSAVYICVVSDRGSTLGKLYFGKGTQLTVRPAIQNPDPAVYQLKSPESSNISVCLFTDFDSEVNVNPSTESNMIRLKSTSLDMKTMDSKSNGALAWSNSFDLGCNSTFNYTFHSSSEFPCDANVVEKGFETDMNLNFDNLTVIMLRIIFLKVVGFNLLMTLKLWSS